MCYTRLTLQEIVAIEPRVADLLERCRTLPDGICGHRAWYEKPFKGTLVNIVGWGCSNPKLKTAAAYSTVYDACVAEFPECGSGRCYNCGRPLPDDLSFKGRYLAKEELTPASATPSWIAVLDMLGYSDSVVAADKRSATNDVLNDLRRIVAETYPYLAGDPDQPLPKDLEDDIDWKFKAYADNIMVNLPTAEIPFSRLHWLCSAMAQFQMAMVLHGQLVRGGLAIGSNYIDDDIAFGRGLIEAHLIEQYVANDPRVVISRRTRRFEASMIDREKDFNWASSSFFMVDADGEWFLDYLALFNGRSGEPYDPIALARHREMVIELCKKYDDDPKLSTKYVWLAQYHDASCASAGRNEFLIDKEPADYPRCISDEDFQIEVDANQRSTDFKHADDDYVLEMVVNTVQPLERKEAIEIYQKRHASTST